MDTDRSDEELLERYRTHRDEAAFQELVRRHREPVFRLALSLLGPGCVGEAEEVAQEVFLRVFHAAASFRGGAAFRTWLYRIAFNQALNVKARVRYRVPHCPIDTLVGLASTDDSPASAAQQRERERLVAECLLRLPEVYQSALRLHYWLEYSVAEIAVLLGVPPNTVKSYLHRARRSLRSLLEQKGVTDV